MGLHLASDEIGFYSGVIVETVTPNYYEQQTERINYKFNLTGQWLLNLPNNCIGILGTSNDNPLSHKNDTSGSFEVDLTEKTSTTAVFERGHQFALRVFLGGIVSADRQTIYWQNDTRPLPQ